MAEPGDAEEVQNAAQEAAADVVFTLALRAGTMPDRDLSVTAAVPQGQQRQEPVKTVESRQIVEHGGSVALERATDVRAGVAEDEPPDPVGDAACEPS